MKKILMFLMVAVAMMSCEGKMGPMGPEGPQGQNGKDGEGANWYTTSFRIESADWKLKGLEGELNSHYYADVEIPKLTEQIFDKGTVIGYVSVADDVKNGLPFVIHVGENINDKDVLWTQTYDFDFEPGWIRFYATYSDFMTQARPGGETFHIVLMW